MAGWAAERCWVGFGVAAPGENPGRAQATGTQPGTRGLAEPHAPPPTPSPSSPSYSQPALPGCLQHFGPLAGKS